MNTFSSNTEEKILLAAQKIFVKTGFDSARMDEIALLAGVNKSALHYYFRSKEKLFETVFEMILLRFVSEIDFEWEQETQLPSKINGFVSKYIDLLSENQHIPFFILNEINRNPEKIIKIIKKHKNTIFKDYLKPKDESFIKLHLIITLLSLCTFPYICEPAICLVLFNSNTTDCHNFLLERKKSISDLIIQSINRTKL